MINSSIWESFTSSNKCEILISSNWLGWVICSDKCPRGGISVVLDIDRPDQTPINANKKSQ